MFRALLDPEAEESFIIERAAQVLRLKRTPVSVPVTGVGSETSGQAKSEVEVILRSPKDDTFFMPFSALVLPKLTNLLPRRKILAGDWPHLKGIELADPDCLVPSAIDCILNAEVFASVMLNGTLPGPAHAPTAQNTRIGWILFGTASAASNRPARQVTNCHLLAHPKYSQPSVMSHYVRAYRPPNTRQRSH